MTRSRRFPRLLFGVLVLLAMLAGNLPVGGPAAAATITASVWAYGSNDNAQLGFERAGFIPHRPTPVQVLGSGANEALALAAARHHSVLVRPDGIVHTWGDNSRGQLGIGSSLQGYNIPREIPSFGQVTAVAAGAMHTLTIAGGRLYGWGDNTRGQLGAGTVDSCGGTGCNRSPVQVALPAGSTVVNVGAGDFHSFAVMADGALWTLGFNFAGQLGSGEPYDTSSIPVRVVGVDGVGFLSGVIAATGGEYHSIALHSDGTVSSWGSNYECQLGIGGPCDPHKHLTPAKVKNLTDVVAIAAGRYHSLALKEDGTVWAWGMSDYGQLGDGTNGEDRSLPVQVVGLTGVKTIEAGDLHSMALKEDGTVWHWGWNDRYQLGNTSGGARVEPVEVFGYGNATKIAAGGSHSLMLRTLEIPSFPDVPTSHQYHDAIGQLAARNIIRGYTDGKFGPDDTTLRAQMAALIARAMGWDVEDHNNPFPDQGDVDASLWRNVGTLAYYSVAKGYPDKLYYPTNEVLYAQTISFITRAMIAKGTWVAQNDIAALYPNVPANSGHRQDIATYIHYVGRLPGTSSVTDTWTVWDQPSTRAWFAQALWLALSR